MSSVLRHYTGYSPSICGPQVSLSLVVFTHVSPWGPGLPRYNLLGALDECSCWSEMGQPRCVRSSLWVAWASPSTAIVSESTLLFLEPTFFPVQGIQWLLWLIHSELYFPPLSTKESRLMLHLGREGQIATVACECAYTEGLVVG
jgi:hypothetical protein